MQQRILLIDDDRVIGLTCRRILGADGHEVRVLRRPAGRPRTRPSPATST